MSDKTAEELAELIMAKAKEFGADLVGIARVEDLKQSPSHQISERMPAFANVGPRKSKAAGPARRIGPKGPSRPL